MPSGNLARSLTQLSVILPMACSIVGSLQVWKAPKRPVIPDGSCLAANGVSSVVAAVCGSCFPTAIYYPGWKAMGASAIQLNSSDGAPLRDRRGGGCRHDHLIKPVWPSCCGSES